MEFSPVALWRRALLLVGLALIGLLWGIGAWNLPIAGNVPGETIFSTQQGVVMWGLLAAALVSFVASYVGSVPDRFAMAVPLGVMANLICGGIVLRLELPFAGDIMGTMFASIVGGPVLGMITACVTTLLWSINSPLVLPHVVSALAVAVVVGLAAVLRKLRRLAQVMVVGLITGLVSGALGAVTILFVMDGVMLPGAASFVDFFLYLQAPEVLAVFLQTLICDPVDKIFALLAATAVVRFGPPVVCEHFTFGGNRLRMAAVLGAYDREVRQPSEPEEEEAAQ